MTEYFEINPDSPGPSRVVAKLDADNLTRLFRGAFRIHDGGVTLRQCDAARLYVDPGGRIGLRLDRANGQSHLAPLDVGSKDGIPLWLHTRVDDGLETYLFVAPPAQLLNQPGKLCARIWLAFYRVGSNTARPPSYQFQKTPGQSPGTVAPCRAIALSSLVSSPSIPFDLTTLQEDEAEGYHED